MSQYSIIVLDTDETRTDFFDSMFKRDEQNVIIYSNITAVLKPEKTTEKAAFLIEYNTLTSENRTDVIDFFKNYSSQDIYIFNVPDNANKRQAFYELGAKCVFDTSQPLEEIYYALTWPLKNLKENRKKNLLISSGKLEDISLKNIIKNLAQEERSGILKIVTHNNSGKIYFREGFITHAQVGLHQGEEAVLHILFWHSGDFTFNATTIFDDRVTIRISLVGLLLISEKLHNEHLGHLQEIGSKDSMIQLKYKDDLANSSIEMVEGFVKFLERPVALNSVLENSFYTCYQTTAKLSQLNKYGFLSVTEPRDEQKSKAKEPEILTISVTDLFDKTEEKQIRKQLSENESTKAKIAVLSRDIDENYSFIRKLVKDSAGILRNEDSNSVRFVLDSDFDVTVYGLSVNEVILEKIESISDGLSGIIFLIDCQKQDVFEYNSYVLRHCVKHYNVPWIIGVFNWANENSPQNIRSQFNIPEHIPMVQFEVEDEIHIKEIILKLKKYEPVENESSELEEKQESV